MQAVRREYHVATVQPAPNFPGVLGPTNLMEYYIVMLTHKDAPESLVYKVVKTVYANKPALVAGHPSFRAFTQAGMAARQDRLQYHPGALKFFKEAGIAVGQ